MSTEAIANRIDKSTTSELAIGRGGELDFANLTQIMEVAKVVSIAKEAIPRHLRENVGACLAICVQASEWKMSPFAVANKSYVVNDRMAYEAQLIAAVILMRAPIKGRLKYTFTGSDNTRRCTCTATLEDGDTVEYTTPEFGKIPVKNSPLWKNDPDQQLSYSAARALARRHFPDVILGVYTPEELAEETVREVTPKGTPTFTQEPTPPRIADSPEPPKPEPEPTPSEPQPEPSPEPEQQSDIDRETMVADLNRRMEKDSISPKTVKAWAHSQSLVASTAIMIKDYPIEALQSLDERWDEVRG